ncbi:MAG: RNA polymerase factor sigma-54 [Caldiserica bacterium]|nr:RNA polymerase factor sigma-54 [Caldisericota bacterium]
MELRTDLLPRQVQRLLLLPQMQQAMQILQLPIMELRNILEQELQQNPFLEVVEKEMKEEEEEINDPLLEEILNLDDNWRDYFRATQNIRERGREDYTHEISARPPSLQDTLLRQLRMSDLSPHEQEIGEILIANIDENGYLKFPLEDIAEVLKIAPSEVEKVLKVIQSFDPPGVGARNLEECLLLQLERKGNANPLLSRVIREYLGDIAGKKFSFLAKKLGISEEEVRKIAGEIAALEPRPGREYSSLRPLYITPDVSVKKTARGYSVLVNQDEVPPIRISPLYRKILEERKKKKKEYQFLREKLRDAVWLLKNLNGRYDLIKKVAEFIVEKQKMFFDKGPKHLKPLTLKEVADVLGVHPSTVSRVTSRKYMETPRGVFPMKYFFSGMAPGNEDMSSTSLKEEVKKIIENEDPENPLSDEKIARILKSKGFPIARRTVSKYREELSILPARMRRK